MSVSAASPAGFFALRPTSLLRARVRVAGTTPAPEQAPATPSRGYFQSLSSRKSYTIDEILALRTKYALCPKDLPDVTCVESGADDTVTWGLRVSSSSSAAASSALNAASSQTEAKRTKLKVKVTRSMEGPMTAAPSAVDADADATVTPLSVSQNRWRPQASTGFPSTLKKLKGILNKLTVDKFDQLAQQFVQLVVTGCPTLVELREAVQLVFDKALDEMTFSDMYTRLVILLSDKVPAIVADHNDQTTKKATFKSVMLSMCQSEFEKAYLAVLPTAADVTGALPDAAAEAELLRLKQRQRLLGNMKFVGELFNSDMLTTAVVVYCARQLTSGLRSDHLEAVCALLEVTGAKLDAVAARSQQGQAQVRDLFQRLTTISNMSPSSTELDSRTRFLIREILELRSGGWVPRRKKQEAMKIDEFRAREEPFRQQMRTATLLPDETVAAIPPLPLRPSPTPVSTRSSRATPRYLDRYARSQNATAISPIVSDSELAKKYDVVVASAPTGAEAAVSAAHPPQEHAQKQQPSQLQQQQLSESDRAQMQKGISSMVREFMRISDRNEVLLCMEELAQPDNTARNVMIVCSCLNEAMESVEPKERVNAAQLVAFLAGKSLIGVADVQAGVEETLEQLPNIIMDLPVAPTRVGEFLAQIVKDGVLPASFVAPSSDALREKVFAVARF